MDGGATDARRAANAVASACRRAAATATVIGRRQRGRHVHRSRDVSCSNSGSQHPDRSDVLTARQPVERHWTAASAPAGSTVRRLAAHLGRAAEPQSLRPLRSADAQAACAALRSHRGHASRQWHTRAVHRNQACGGARLVAERRNVAAACCADAGAALLRAESVRSKPRSLGRVRMSG